MRTYNVYFDTEALRAQEQEIDSLRRQLSRLQKAKPASPVKQNNMIENKTAGKAI